MNDRCIVYRSSIYAVDIIYVAFNISSIVVAGDGRYYNNEAIQTIARLLAATGIGDIWIPQHG